MPVTITFTSALHRHVSAPTLTLDAGTVREALAAAFAASPDLRRYVLDDQGGIRKHIDVFIGPRRLQDRLAQSDVIPPGSTVFVLQALSGG